MKNVIQKSPKAETVKLEKNYSSLENALVDKHKKANDFIKKVKLTF
ncbi:MAG: hypothetical protein U0V04_09715 [Spirosomataceae bacterium]|jgi:hypothetical protein